jgi:hypothetical protein
MNLVLPNQTASSDFVHYDVSLWPLVTITAGGGEPSDEDFQCHLDCFSRILNHNMPMVMLFDLRRANMVDFKFVQRQADFLFAHDKQIKQNLLASAVVTDSEWFKNMLKMLYMIRPLTKPNEAFSSEIDAQNYLYQFWVAYEATLMTDESGYNKQ